MKKIVQFTDLLAWQEAHKLVLLIYKLTKNFPKQEMYSLVDQMRRASSSISANIAEGFGRQTYRDRIRFYYLSQGSLNEVKNFAILARDLNYLSLNDFEQVIIQANTAHQLLQGLITKSKTFITLNS